MERTTSFHSAVSQQPAIIDISSRSSFSPPQLSTQSWTSDLKFFKDSFPLQKPQFKKSKNRFLFWFSCSWLNPYHQISAFDLRVSVCSPLSLWCRRISVKSQILPSPHLQSPNRKTRFGAIPCSRGNATASGIMLCWWCQRCSSWCIWRCTRGRTLESCAMGGRTLWFPITPFSGSQADLI